MRRARVTLAIPADQVQGQQASDLGTFHLLESQAVLSLACHAIQLVLRGTWNYLHVSLQIVSQRARDVTFDLVEPSAGPTPVPPDGQVPRPNRLPRGWPELVHVPRGDSQLGLRRVRRKRLEVVVRPRGACYELLAFCSSVGDDHGWGSIG